MAASDEHYVGICQSRNRGHQNAVLVGLMEAKSRCDITISIDCDGQDDINAMDGMVDAYPDGCDVVYGVRSKRDTDTFFKRFTAESFYKLLNAMGAEVVFNHADYRLLSARVLEEFAKFKGGQPVFARHGAAGRLQVHLRDLRAPRAHCGREPLSLSKMLALAFDGITSLSIKADPLHHRLRRFCGTGQLYRRAVGRHRGCAGADCLRLGVYDQHHLLCIGRTA